MKQPDVYQSQLVAANERGYWTLQKDTQFHLRRLADTDNLKKPLVVIKKGTTVFVKKQYRRGRAALLCYIDCTGKVWWSWAHSNVYDLEK